mgnify:CR=1 FL=1
MEEVVGAVHKSLVAHSLAIIVDEDINLSEGTLKINDDKGTEEKDDDEKFEYISAGGLASKTVIETKTVLSIETEKTFTDVNDHSKGGTMSVTFVFTDGTSEVVYTDVASYLVNDIPVYVGSDNYWYIGNTYSKVQYERLYKDAIAYINVQGQIPYQPACPQSAAVPNHRSMTRTPGTTKQQEAKTSRQPLRMSINSS